MTSVRLLAIAITASVLAGTPAAADEAFRQMKEIRGVCIRMHNDYADAVTRSLAKMRTLSAEFSPDGTMSPAVFNAADHAVRMRMRRMTFVWIVVSHPSRVTARGCKDYLLEEARNVLGYIDETMRTENLPAVPLLENGNRDGTPSVAPSIEEERAVFRN